MTPMDLLHMQSGILKRIEEKEAERDSFELQITNVNLTHIDERERNLVRDVVLYAVFWQLIIVILDFRKHG